jgi:hypothetical protein
MRNRQIWLQYKVACRLFSAYLGHYQNTRTFLLLRN